MEKNYDAKNFYSILGVTPDAPIDFIKKNYYEKAKYWHPDHNEQENAMEVFQKISVAYDVLKNEKSRLIYDLLSSIYNADNFPDMNSLKIYKNQYGQDDVSLRVIKQCVVTSFPFKNKLDFRKDICGFYEAKSFILNTSIHNWIMGWWSLKGFIDNIKAIRYNYQNCQIISEENIILLVHNALAYEQSGNIEKSWICAKQAYLYSANDSRIKQKLNEFIALLNYTPTETINIPLWKTSELRFQQILFPVIVAAILCVALLLELYKSSDASEEKSYYQEIVLNNGDKITDDKLDSHIITVKFDLSDSKYLYHLNKKTDIYYGPDKRYGKLATVDENKTIRILGYTIDKSWYKIMLDNGSSGYVKKEFLVEGIGKSIPAFSQIYRKTAY